MASESVTSTVEQCFTIKFLVKEEVKPAEIRRRLSARYGEDTLSLASVYDLCNKFSEGRPQVANQTHGHIQPTAVTDVNIRRIEELNLENRRINVGFMASKVCVNTESVETIIHEHIMFKCAHGGSQRC